MEPSPLTQQARPEVFQQKIVELYDTLFKVIDAPRCAAGKMDTNLLPPRMKKTKS